MSRTLLGLAACIAIQTVLGQWNLNVGPGVQQLQRDLSSANSNLNTGPGFSAQSSFFPSQNAQFVGQSQRGVRTNMLSSDTSTNGQSTSGDSSFFASGGGFSGAQQAVNSIGTPYYGARLGSLNTYQHGISGEAFAVDDETLLIKRFTYDGQVPDAYLYIGNSETVQPYQALRLSNAQGQQVPLTRSDGQDVVFKLGSGGNIRQYRWAAVMSLLANSNFGEVFFPRDFSPPKSVSLGPLTQSAGYLPQSVRSGLVTIINDKQIQIQNFVYDGQAPDAFFWAGQGAQPGPSGAIIPFQNSYTKLPAINGQTVTLTLPGNINIQNINWLAVWSRTLNTYLAYVMIPGGLNVPPTLSGTPQSSPETANLLDLPNCEVYGNGLVQVRWAVQGQDITIQLTGRLDNGQYVAFGISGNQNRVFMINSDVAVAYWDLTANTAVVQDFMISARQECDGNTGVCPDTRSGGADDIQLISGTRENGFLTVQYKRRINTGDRLDMVINPQIDTYVVWAIGPLNRQNLPSVHYAGMHATTERIRFGRTPIDNCPANFGEPRPMSPGIQNSVPQQDTYSTSTANWQKQYILGNQTKTFIATIGPAAGSKGYSSLYGKPAPNGVVWYINGKMAPELVLRRSETYRFIIYGGNNPRDAQRYHPLYITTDSSGGYSSKPRSGQAQEFPGIRGGTTQAAGSVVPIGAGQYCEFASNAQSDPDMFASFEEFNRTLSFQCDGTQPGRFPVTDGVIGVFDFTPSSQEASTLYYQCFNHKDMGGRITLVNMYRDFSPSSKDYNKPAE